MKKSELRQIIKEEVQKLLKESTIYQELIDNNPGWNRESVMDFIKDEFDTGEWIGDTEKSEHEEYMQDAKEWFDRVESLGESKFKVGDKVQVFEKMKRKFIPGIIVGETFMKGAHMFSGRIEPDKIPAWEIKEILPNGKKGASIFYPKYQQGQGFK
jgi:hypothetical protein